MHGRGCPFRDLFFLHQHICTTDIVRAESQSKSVNKTTSTILSLLFGSVHSCASPESGTRVNPTPAQRHLSMGSPRQCSRVTQRQDHELTSCLVSKPYCGMVATPPSLSKPRSPGHLAPPRPHVSARRPASSSMICFCFVPCAGSCGVRRPRYFCTHEWILFFLFLDAFPWRRVLSYQEGGRGKKNLARLLVTPPPCTSSRHYFIVLLRLFLSFLFLSSSCHTQPANAMRQLSQTTISLCVAEAVVRTRSFAFFLSSFFLLSFTLVTPLFSLAPCLLVDAGAFFLCDPI